MVSHITLGMIGGLGLFLFGMKTMASGLQKAAGDRLRRILEILTANPYMATLTGALVTILVQSSSTTNVMVVSFANSGLMTLSQALGTMLGANIGTTFTAQLISFDIYVITYPVIGIGSAIHLFAIKKFYKSIGQGILGFGLLFLGLQIMSEAMYPLRDYPPFIDLLASFGAIPILWVLAGAIFTAMIQSSSATAGVVIAMTLQGMIDTPSAIAIVLGANIGTSITAALASIGTNLTAKRAVLGIVCVKVSGVLLALLLFHPFVNMISYTGSTVTRQVANAHTIFNVLNVIIVLPFVHPITRLIQRILPGEVQAVESGTKNLNRRLLRSPTASIGVARQELLRMARIAREMLSESMTILHNRDRGMIDATLQKEDLIDSLEKEITGFLAEIGQNSLGRDQSQTITALMHFSSDLERIGDHAENIIQLAETKIDSDMIFSDHANKELKDFYGLVDEMLDWAITSFAKEDKDMAQAVIEKGRELRQLERSLRKNHTSRINQKLCVPQSGVIYLDLLSNLQRVADHSTNLAEVVTGDF